MQIQKMRAEMAKKIYSQLCDEIRGMGMVEMLEAKKAWSNRCDLDVTPKRLQERVQRIADAALSVSSVKG